jgi:hypothetical protein
VSQVIHDFLASDAPPPAKDMVRSFEARYGFDPTDELTGVRLVLTADGPVGKVQLYALKFASGGAGTATVFPGNFTAGWYVRPLKPGEAFRVYGGAGTEDSVMYFDGRADSSVATVDVVYEDGHTERVASGGGYVLGWVRSNAHGRYGFGQIIARSAAGAEVGRAYFCQHGDIVSIPDYLGDFSGDPVAACAIPLPSGSH